jgi:hypothetical protein
MTTNLHRWILSAASLIWVAACASSQGFEQPAPRKLPAHATPVVNDAEVAKALNLQAQLPQAYRLGVYFRDDGTAADGQPFRWTGEQRTQLLRALESLEGKGTLARVFPIAASLVASDELAAIRVGAARHGADVVLVLSSETVAERSLTGWAASYVALLPMLFAPGNALQVRCNLHAELWDVRNEYLYLAAESESEVKQVRALAHIDAEEGDLRARKQALELLTRELQKRLQRLDGQHG